jgi:hypothetical protein
MVANRRTMTGSLIIANVTVYAARHVYLLLASPKSLGLGWQVTSSMLISSVYGMLAVTLTEIAVALFVARKVRRSPR